MKWSQINPTKKGQFEVKMCINRFILIRQNVFNLKNDSMEEI